MLPHPHDYGRIQLRAVFSLQRSPTGETLIEEGDYRLVKHLPCGHPFKTMALAIMLNLGSYKIWELRALIEHIERKESVGIESIFGELITCVRCREAFLHLVTGFMDALIAMGEES